MTPQLQTNGLIRLFESHDIHCQVDDHAWILPYGKLPAIRATWFPRESNGRLDVEVLLEDERVIVECFAGIGPGEKGLADALQNLCVNSFHVLLSAFWQRTDPEQVMIEDWEVGRGQFRAYIGNLGTRGSDSVAAQIPADLFPAIESSIKKEPMDERPHWFRHFFADVNGEQTFESLYDNEEWAAGVESMKALPWVKSKGYYSVRHFLLLMPTDDA